MKPIRPAVLLLTVQALLILSIAGKYLYERKTQPRIWARAIAIDPEAPLRAFHIVHFELVREENQQLRTHVAPRARQQRCTQHFGGFSVRVQVDERAVAVQLVWPCSSVHKGERQGLHKR